MSITSRVVAVEEHYLDADIARARSRSAEPYLPLVERLSDIGALRLADMDAAGIDVQVISHGAPSLDALDAAALVPLIRRTNDRLHQAISHAPERFAAFALLPTIDPVAAADELERAVDRLGFKGAMIHGLVRGAFLDEKRFWPIFERAEALDVPIYIHPARPHQAVIDAYLKDYATEFPTMLSAAWGFTIEAATQGIRLILSGLFEAHPRLKIILGHLGESLPFSLWRIDEALSQNGRNAEGWFRDQFCENFYVTTSNFSTSALQCCLTELGADRILFAVDWPFADNVRAMDWLAGIRMSPDDRRKILGGNAARILRL